MNTVVIRYTCPCGAGLEIEGPESSWIRFRNQAEQWRRQHAECVKSSSAGRAEPTPDPSQEGSRTVQTLGGK
jgi:hypothetical protein